MSTKSPTVGGTLAGGIQDIAAILPLIGTEQCEKHVGSALAGGYLYAAATPLSIFGSLGIVKIGITILISSISTSIPHISISFSNYKLSIKYLGQRKWLGGRALKDAGFELTGSVAPLIGMQGDRFRAETQLIEMLEEKHIDDPDKVFVDWKSRQWNRMLVISTLLGAILSLAPYVILLLGPVSWKPSSIHLPWLFPALRIVGSCTATIACQIIIQCRVISLMKNRILFMTIQQKLKEIHKDGLDTWLKGSCIKWDASLPAEQCIWSLEHYLSSVAAHRDTSRINHVAIEMASDDISSAEAPSAAPSAPMPSSPETPTFEIDNLQELQDQHFQTPLRDTIVISLSWFFLLLSLPATVAGYIGCFTLVSVTPPSGSGPLVWVGLEAALSAIRIIVWACNPAFDEETEVTLGIRLSQHQPMVTTPDYNPFITEFNGDNEEIKPFALIPEHEFLEYITPYTGPIDQIQKPHNITIYFTLTQYYHHGAASEDMCLIMTALVSDTQTGISFMFSKGSFYYVNVSVKYDAVTRQLEANLESKRQETRPWRVEDDSLFDSLEGFYHYITGIRNQTDIKRFKTPTATLLQKWDLSEISRLSLDSHAHDVRPPIPTPRSLSPEDELYLSRGYEYHLKSKLINIWSKWIVQDMETLRAHATLDCGEALRDMTGQKGNWELTELDFQLVWGWTHWELALLRMSMDLEDIVQARMGKCTSEVVDIRKDKRLRTRMDSESVRSQRKTMEQERKAASKRMTGAMEHAIQQAKKEGRAWKGDHFSPQWKEAIKFIDLQWLFGTDNLRDEIRKAEDGLRKMQEDVERSRQSWDGDRDRNMVVQHLRERVSNERWRNQAHFEQQIMEGTINDIRNLPKNCTRDKMDKAYRFQGPDSYANARFTVLTLSESAGRACSAMVYDAEYCGMETVCNVIAKTTTRSVIRVDPKIVASIPPNDHLLFLRCKGDAGEEPPFVQQNRDKWPGQQQENSYIFYFTPSSVKSEYCYNDGNETIAHILVFLTGPCNVHVSLFHFTDDKVGPASVSLQRNKTEVAAISHITESEKLKFEDFPLFQLPRGRHELELIPSTGDLYYLRDILIQFYPIEKRSVQFSAEPEVQAPSSRVGRTILRPEHHSSLSLSTNTDTRADFTVHPLLSYTQYGSATGHNQPSVWNILEPAIRAGYPSDPTRPISEFDLGQPATYPPMPTLHIVSSLFFGYWPITIRRLEGHVTVGDVLEEIHNVLIKRISQDEWGTLSDKQKMKIADVFETRCNNDIDPSLCRSKGVIRIDCLIEHTWFSGLSMSFDVDSTCILTLRRGRHPQSDILLDKNNNDDTDDDDNNNNNDDYDNHNGDEDEDEDNNDVNNPDDDDDDDDSNANVNTTTTSTSTA